jgi:hypothetical protein
MNWPIARVFAAAALVVVTLTSCSDNNNTTPTPVFKTESFSGSIAAGKTVIHPYAVNGAGTATTTLKGLVGADYVGLGTGTWDGTTCSIGIHREDVVVGGTFVADVPSPQNLCAMIYDVGRIATTATYTIEVVHP